MDRVLLLMRGTGEFLRGFGYRCLLLLGLVVPTLLFGQFLSTTNNGGIVIAGYTGPGGAVTIPDEITGMPVIKIGNYAFAYSPNLTSIILSSNVIAVGDMAFEECPELTSVTLMGGVTSIGGGAFQNCPGLTSINIPDSVTNLGDVAFAGCTALTNAVVGNGVRKIGYRAFSLCRSLVTVKIGDSVTRLDAQAFDYCTNVITIAIPASMDSIDLDAFMGCLNLTAIDVDANNLFYASEDGVLFSQPRNWLLRCPMGKAGSYKLPESVTSIEPHAFEYCIKLTSVSIPDSMYFIQDSAFYYCTGLSNIAIGNGVGILGPLAFYFCSSLTSVIIPASVQNIGWEAFGSCDKLEYVFFQGDAPNATGSILGVTPTVYYLPGTTGWSTAYSGRPAVLWNPFLHSSGVRSNQFGFTISGNVNIAIALEASPNAAGPWTLLQSGTLTNGSIYFCDSAWTNYPSRFYRIRSP